MNSCHSKEGERGGIITNLIVLLFFVIFCAVLYLARYSIKEVYFNAELPEQAAANLRALDPNS